MGEEPPRVPGAGVNAHEDRKIHPLQARGAAEWPAGIPKTPDGEVGESVARDVPPEVVPIGDQGVARSGFERGFNRRTDVLHEHPYTVAVVVTPGREALLVSADPGEPLHVRTDRYTHASDAYHIGEGPQSAT